jgi:hypothetical protein
VPELREALASANFREVFFVTQISGEWGFVPLNALHLVSEAFFFEAFLSESERLPEDTDEAAIFASYFKGTVSNAVHVRSDEAGTEVIYGDCGIINGRETFTVRQYTDLPIPEDVRLIGPEPASIFRQGLETKIKEFRGRKRFTSPFWFPVKFGARWLRQEDHAAEPLP